MNVELKKITIEFDSEKERDILANVIEAGVYDQGQYNDQEERVYMNKLRELVKHLRG